MKMSDSEKTSGAILEEDLARTGSVKGVGL